MVKKQLTLREKLALLYAKDYLNVAIVVRAFLNMNVNIHTTGNDIALLGVRVVRVRSLKTTNTSGKI